MAKAPNTIEVEFKDGQMDALEALVVRLEAACDRAASLGVYVQDETEFSGKATVSPGVSGPDGYRHWTNCGGICLMEYVGPNCPCVRCAKAERPDAIEGPIVGDASQFIEPVGLWIPEAT
jgi:hypothetical protein